MTMIKPDTGDYRMTPDSSMTIDTYRAGSVHVEVRKYHNGDPTPVVLIQHPLSTSAVEVRAEDLDDLTEILMSITTDMAKERAKIKPIMKAKIQLSDGDLADICERAAHLAEYVELPADAQRVVDIDVIALVDELQRRKAAGAVDMGAEPEA